MPRSSATSLNDRLHDLVRLGLVTRHADLGPPLRSTYEVTDAGALLGTHLHGMVEAAQRHDLFFQQPA